MSSYKYSISNLCKIPYVSIVENRYDDVDYTFGICTYKRASELQDALESIFSQKTNIRFNVIVTDNNPERYDETEQLIASKYSNKPNIHYLKNSENTEVAGNWNRMFQQCKSKYLIMLHDDDVLFENYLEQMDKLVKKHPEYDIINCEKITWNGSDVVCRNSTVKSLIEHNIYTNMLSFTFNTPSGALFNVEKIIELDGYNWDYEHALDYAFMMRFFANGGKAAKTVQPLMLYRWGNNASSKYEILHNLLVNDYKLKHDISRIVKMNALLFKIFEFFDVKIRLRSILKINGINETFHGYKSAGTLCLCFLKLFSFPYNKLYIDILRKKKI